MADALALKADLAGVDLTLSQMRQEISDLNVGVSRRAEIGRVEEVSRGGGEVGGGRGARGEKWQGRDGVRCVRWGLGQANKPTDT